MDHLSRFWPDHTYQTMPTPRAACRTLKVTIILLACVYLFLKASTLLAFAQEPPLFEINVAPASSQVIAGQTLTYTITITNVSGLPQQNVLVTVDTPPGTTYNHSNLAAQQRWLIGGFTPGQPGTITWITQETLPPGGTAMVELVVNVLPNTAGEIVNQNYFVTTLNNYEQARVSGPPVKTQALIPTPTPTPTATPQPATTATSTSKPTASFTPAAPATPTPSSQSAATASPPPIEPETVWPALVGWIGGLAIIGIVAGLGWILLKKQ